MKKNGVMLFALKPKARKELYSRYVKPDTISNKRILSNIALRFVSD